MRPSEKPTAEPQRSARRPLMADSPWRATRRHPLAISDQIGATARRLRQGPVEERRRDADKHGERGRVGRARAVAEEVGPLAEDRRERSQRPLAELDDLGRVVPPETMRMNPPEEARPSFVARRIGKPGEETAWALGEIGVVGPTQMQERPIEMVLQHALDRPADRALLGAEAGIEVDAARALDMAADEG